MGIHQEDLRVIKTKRGLREAFIRLLLDKGYDAISIKDIAEEAEAARVTFYRHYKNKEELLIDCIDRIFEDIEKRIRQASKEEDQPGTSPMLVCYQQIQNDGQILRLLSKSQAGHLLMARLTVLFAERFTKQIEAQIPAEERLAPIDIIAHHMASALVGLINWWIEHDQPYSADYMANITYWLSLAGSARGLGREKIAIVPPEFPTPVMD